MLDVQHSLMRARWQFPLPDISAVSEMVARHQLPEIIARLLVSRGIQSGEAERFLNPTLREDFPDPFSLKGMKEAAEYLAQSIVNKRSISIFGDFDVDGATSAAVLYRFLKHFGYDAPIYIPDRMTEGYGPNAEAFHKLKREGAEIVILCDCGTTAFDAVEAATKTGLEIVILDHHETEAELPDALHVVNPKRRDCNAGLENLAAVGVVFLTCVAINNILRSQRHFERSGIAEFPLKELLDIVALGTVCDMVPVTGANRLLVRAGLQAISGSPNIGLQALMNVSKVSGQVGSYHCGFILGPRINAGSRVHRSDLGARLLATDKEQEAQDIAWCLEDANKKRKLLQSKMFKEAVSKVEAFGLEEASAIVVSDESWHAGLAGLVAGRLKEMYRKPAAVIAFSENAEGTLEGRGSCRSIPGINVAEALIAARNAGLLIKGGGHAMAGGFTIAPDQISNFTEFFTVHLRKQAECSDAIVETNIDGILSIRGLKTELVDILENNIGPFGEGNREPVFAFPQVKIISSDIVGDGHVKVLLSDWEGGARIRGIAFRSAETALGMALLKNNGQPFHIAGHLKINSWNGKDNVELNIMDAAYAMAADADMAERA